MRDLSENDRLELHDGAPPPDGHFASARRPIGWPVAAALAGILALVYLLRNVLLPFAVAGGIAFLVAPLVTRLHRHGRWPRWVAVTAVYLGVLAVMAILGVGVRIAIVPEITNLATNGQRFITNVLLQMLHGHTLHVGGGEYTADELSRRAIDGLTRTLATPANAFDAIGNGFAIVVGFTLTLVLLFYFMLQGPRLRRGMLWLAPPRLRPAVSHLALEADPMLRRYLIGVFCVVMYAALITWPIAHFLHLPEPLLLSLAVGLLELIPMIGPILSLVLFALASAQTPTLGAVVGFAAFALILRLSIDLLVGPIILGKAVELPPPVVILAFLAGGVLFGVLGVLLAIPAAALIKIVLTQVYEHPATGRAVVERAAAAPIDV